MLKVERYGENCERQKDREILDDVSSLTLSDPHFLTFLSGPSHMQHGPVKPEPLASWIEFFPC